MRWVDGGTDYTDCTVQACTTLRHGEAENQGTCILHVLLLCYVLEYGYSTSSLPWFSPPDTVQLYYYRR